MPTSAHIQAGCLHSEAFKGPGVSTTYEKVKHGSKGCIRLASQDPEGMLSFLSVVSGLPP